tara:strand:+ start:1455 stop:1568 length:114 start_codon:yes stop_codon:yes gene_type:complete
MILKKYSLNQLEAPYYLSVGAPDLIPRASYRVYLDVL